MERSKALMAAKQGSKSVKLRTLKDPSEFSTKKKQKMRDDWLPGGVGRNRTHDRIHASHALERFQSVSGTWCETERQKEFAVGTQSLGITQMTIVAKFVYLKY